MDLLLGTDMTGKFSEGGHSSPLTSILPLIIIENQCGNWPNVVSRNFN